MAQAPLTATAIAEQVRAALSSADLAGWEALLSPDVRWGAPDDRGSGCQNRKEVMAWYRRGRKAGVRATVTEVTVHDDKILVGLNVLSPDGAADRWQILTVGAAGVCDIRGFEARQDALARLAS
jgi:ketosteroid isomerase-like protein